MTEKELHSLVKELRPRLPKSVKVSVSEPGAFDYPVFTIVRENEQWFNVDYVPTRGLTAEKCREAILTSNVVNTGRTQIES